MQYLIQLVEKGALPKALRKAHARVMKSALEAGLRHWHTVYRPLHFQQAAYHRYPIYNLRERRDSKPLYYTGETMRRSEKMDFRGTSKQMRAVYNLPALNFGAAGRKTKDGKKAKPINLRGEFTAVNNPEQSKLQKVIVEHYTKIMQWLRETSTKKIGKG